MKRNGAWNPAHYLTYADERGRPFAELLARIDAEPDRVVDLGCGPGNQTALLADRWPGADVTGVDDSTEMIAAARSTVRDSGPLLRFEVGDVRTWRPDGPVDVLITNATLQWVPGHLDLLPRLVDQVAAGGWFAMSVPGNFAEPSHTIRRDLETQAPYAEHAAGLSAPVSHDPEVYLSALSDLGLEVDAWGTTYLHVLDASQDPDPVFTWVSGTSARPVLGALPGELREDFVGEFKQRLAAAYPTSSGRVVLPFRRVFAVGRRGSV